MADDTATPAGAASATTSTPSADASPRASSSSSTSTSPTTTTDGATPRRQSTGILKITAAHQVRSIHWSPYDRVGVVNADP